MKNFDFLLRTRVPFLGIENDYDEADFFFFGVPYDLTSSFRNGAAQGPEALRKFSANIEANSYRRKIDVSTAKVHDGGDVIYVYELERMLKRVHEVVSNASADDKVTVMIGGEHTFTLPAVEALKEKASCLVVFDAHFDLRDEYLGSKLNHATYLRRLVEANQNLRVVVVGVRGYDLSELKFAEDNGVTYVSTSELDDLSRVLRVLTEAVDDGRPYISLDIDVIDPAYAPGVGNPEPEGATPTQIIDLINFLGTYNPVGFDLMELNPLFDNGVTASLAARIVFEFMAAVRER